VPSWLDWVNADRIGVIVAILAAGTAALYAQRQVGVARRQAEIAEEARDEARRSADAAEQQVRIAEAARAEAQRASDAAEAAVSTGRDALRMEARRDHYSFGPVNVALAKTERRPNPRVPSEANLFAVLDNPGSRAFTCVGRLHLKAGGYQPWGPEKLDAGSTGRAAYSIVASSPIRWGRDDSV
jgi:hypothetical protein